MPECRYCEVTFLEEINDNAVCPKCEKSTQTYAAAAMTGILEPAVLAHVIAITRKERDQVAEAIARMAFEQAHAMMKTERKFMLPCEANQTEFGQEGG